MRFIHPFADEEDGDLDRWTSSNGGGQLAWEIPVGVGPCLSCGSASTGI